MSRKDDLENNIRESYQIMDAYQAILRTSERPEEKARARREIEAQWALCGAAWKELKQRLLTQASRLPAGRYLDAARMDAAAAGMARPCDEVRTMLAAYRIDPDPGVERALARVQAAWRRNWL